MEQGIFGEVNLFADQDKENEKYINAIDAIELIKFKTDNLVPDVCRFLILKQFNYSTQTYKKDYLGRILANDSRIEDVPFEDWSITSDILKKGLEDFKYSGSRYSDNYEKADYEHYYWLKSDFFNFEAIQKLNITPDDYSDFLMSKVILWGSKRKKDTFIEEMEKLDECELPIKNKTIPLLYKKPLLTLHEAACIMTEYNPQYVEQCQNDTNFKENFSNYLEAYDYICTCIDAQMLCYNPMDNRIDAKDFKQFLANDDRFIDGFNDGLDESKSNIMDGDLNTQKIISNLELDLAIEKTKVEKLNEEIGHLKAHIAELESKKMQYPQKENAINDDKINIANSDLLLISVLMTTLRSEIKVKGKNSQAKVLQRIEDEHGSIKGLSKSRTEKVLASANSLYKSLINNEMK